MKSLTRTTILCFLLTALPLSGCATLQSLTGQKDATVVKATTALKERGQLGLKQRRYDLAANSFQAALKLDENDDEARLGLAETLLKQQKNDEAFKQFQKLLKQPKLKRFALQGIGLLEIQRGNRDAAKESLNLAVSENPSLWRAWNGLAQIFDLEKNWKESSKAYESALKHTTEPQVIHNNMGVSWMAQKKFKKAAESFQKALEYEPDLEAAKTNYRLALAMQSRYDDATVDTDVKEEARALNNAGYAAMLKGDYAEAERLFAKSIEISPSFYKMPEQNMQILNHIRDKKKK